MENEKCYWIGFNLVKGIGAGRLRRLLDHFGTIDRAWYASRRELRLAGLGEQTADKLISVRNLVDLEKLIDDIKKQDIRIVTWNDGDYPERLREIDLPPPVLFVRGVFSPKDHWGVGIVGTRRVTSYGRTVTTDLVRALVPLGVTIISGLARGVDTIAHRAALTMGGRTIGVLGSGVDRIYPPENRSLVNAMIGQGAVISDYAVGTAPDGGNFPPRNRIISGLSMVVVIIEAGVQSGALITANFAADQGREVFALPGNITAPQSQGTNKLIKQGARPLTSPEDVIEILDLTRMIEQSETRSILPETVEEEQICTLLSLEPLDINEISAQTGLEISNVSATLTMMELKGLIRQVEGRQYIVAA